MGKRELMKFREAKAWEIDLLEEKGDKGLYEDIAAFNRENPNKRVDFLEALTQGLKSRGISIVAEYKRASPSKGDIEVNLSFEEVALMYEKADAISVLTEEKYFKGSINFLKGNIKGTKPLLRKDFIFHPFQVYATAATFASAILFIVRLTPSTEELRALINLAESLSLTPVVEIFNAEELEIARAAGAKVIQINARDLETFNVDFLLSLKLIASNPPLNGEFFILASGLNDSTDLIVAKKMGFSSVLIGTALMKGGKPKENLDKFLLGLDRLLGYKNN
jgi:indole-3-glycerol phosphate synthase